MEVIKEIAAIEKAWAEHVEMENRRGPQDPHPYIYASSRRECRRRMYYECTDPNSFPQFDTDTKARFTRGNQRERDISIDLMRVGRLCIPKFDFIGQQERIGIFDRKGRKVISGKIDGFLKWESGAQWPTELKSWSVFLTDRIFQFSDLFNNKWTKAGAFQLLAYLFEKNAPYGVMVLDRPGLPRLIPVSLEENFDKMESFIADGEAVVDAIEAKTPPDFIDDPGECRKCPVFGSLCQPNMSFEGASIITDESLLLAIEQHETLDEPRKEYKDVHEQLAEHLATMTPKTATKDNKKQIVAGKFLITSHWGPNTTYAVPEKIKAEYKSVDATGRFNFSIDKVSE